MKRKETMFALIAKWKESGLTKGEFALANNISSTTMGKWCKRYNAEAIERQNKTSQFLEITPHPQPEENTLQDPQRLAKIDIELPCGIRIKIY